MLAPLSGHELDQNQVGYIKNNFITLADPKYVTNQPLHIDILIGQDYIYEIIKEVRLLGPNGMILIPIFNKTYIICGKSNYLKSNFRLNNEVNLVLQTNYFETLSLEQEQITLDRFISLESLGIGPL